ncbi:hypothetical protein EYF80_000166 [Liparis tanakae]|uniref:Uncharacterized protein n=1 Tax=Liparis tanakae TaxID=230148 RepID=A0A4Z2JIC5_9TELE|nr:hypothetical protein EYF80_000166 [Liparis tanakae]
MARGVVNSDRKHKREMALVSVESLEQTTTTSVCSRTRSGDGSEPTEAVRKQSSSQEHVERMTRWPVYSLPGVSPMLLCFPFQYHSSRVASLEPDST